MTAYAYFCRSCIKGQNYKCAIFIVNSNDIILYVIKACALSLKIEICLVLSIYIFFH